MEPHVGDTRPTEFLADGWSYSGFTGRTSTPPLLMAPGLVNS